MKFPFLVAVLAIGGLIGWFSPDAAPAPAGPPERAMRHVAHVTPPSRAPLQAGNLQAWGAGEVVLPREADGHFYADVSVDSVTSRMLVDTGASVVALTGEDAENMGIYWDEADVRPVAQGANGPVLGVRVTLDRVQLGDIEADAVEAIVVPDGLGISLLGQSFLGRIERVEITQAGMQLGG